MNEEQKIEAFLKGNDDYYDVVYNKYKLLVYRQAKSILKNEEASEDITQDVFIILYQKRDMIQDPRKVGAWLKRTAYTRSLNSIRTENEVLTDEETDGLFDIQENTDMATMPEDSLDQKETAEIVKNFLFHLSEEQRAVMMAYYFDQMKISEIAATFGCSENTVKSRMNYAKKSLYKMASDYERREGVRLHSFGGTIVLLAFLKLQDGIAMTETASSAIYASVCKNVGLSLAASAAKGETAAGAAKASAAKASAARKTAASTAKEVLKTGAGKAVIGVTAAAVVTAGVVTHNSQENIKDLSYILDDLQVAVENQDYDRLSLYFFDGTLKRLADAKWDNNEYEKSDKSGKWTLRFAKQGKEGIAAIEELSYKDYKKTAPEGISAFYYNDGNLKELNYTTYKDNQNLAVNITNPTLSEYGFLYGLDADLGEVNFSDGSLKVRGAGEDGITRKAINKNGDKFVKIILNHDMEEGTLGEGIFPATLSFDVKGWDDEKNIKDFFSFDYGFGDNIDSTTLYSNEKDNELILVNGGIGNMYEGLDIFSDIVIYNYVTGEKTGEYHSGYKNGEYFEENLIHSDEFNDEIQQMHSGQWNLNETESDFIDSIHNFLSSYPLCKNLEETHEGWTRLVKVSPYDIETDDITIVVYNFDEGMWTLGTGNLSTDDALLKKYRDEDDEISSAEEKEMRNKYSAEKIEWIKKLNTDKIQKLRYKSNK